ncbi:MAG TPA: 5'-nucleotidase C-terminal domain-containing protein [Bacilli bacterium]|nr:5'-nucleotidase C-terminal domain-containing protein [Bacilli bacterium]
MKGFSKMMAVTLALTTVFSPLTASAATSTAKATVTSTTQVAFKDQTALANWAADAFAKANYGQSNNDGTSGTPSVPNPVRVHRDVDALIASAILNGNESLDRVTGDLLLPTSGANGSTITWASSAEDVIRPDGSVTRFDAENRTVTLTATVARGSYEQTKTFEVTVFEAPFAVQLLSINDLHGKIDQTYYEDTDGDGAKEALGRADYFATYLKQREATNPTNTLIVHAGDAVGGSSPVSALFQDEPTIEILENIGFDVGTIGNHELDEGTTEMLRLINGGDHPNGTANYDGMNFPLLAANVVYKDSGEPGLPPDAIKTVRGEKIGFVGVVTRSAAGMVMPAGIQDLEFTDEAPAVNQAVAELKAQGVKAIVVLAHMDLTQNGDAVEGVAADLANDVDDEVDVILAAHNHKIAKGYVDNKLLVQAYEYGKAFADVDLEIDPATHDIVSKDAEVVYVKQDGVTPDAEVSAILDKYETAIAPTLNQVVGTTAIPMVGGYTNTGDNTLGNLIADSMNAAMNSDFALMNGGGIRDTLDAGDITWNELFNILPFNNQLMTFKIKGSDLESIVNAQLSVRYGPDFSIAGFKYKYNFATGLATDITLPDGSAIDPDKTYTLTCNNFMGTSTSSKYKAISDAGTDPQMGPEDLEALVDYVKNYSGTLDYSNSLGRIQYANALTATNYTGATDTLTVTDLLPGNIVKVYDTASDSTPLGSATVADGADFATVTGLDLGADAGTIYVTNTALDPYSHRMQEGPRYAASYEAEGAVTDPQPQESPLSVATTTFTESEQNDGTITGSQVLTLAQGTLAADLSKADVTVNNLPAGLDYAVTRDSDTQFTVSFSGQAAEHLALDTISDVTVTVAQAKVTGATDDVTSASFGFSFADPTGTISMAYARHIQAHGYTGSVTVHGVVTADNAVIGNGKLSTYIQDETGGLNLFDFSASAYPDLKAGDEVEVTGTLTTYGNLTELKPSDASAVTVLAQGQPLPTAKAINMSALLDPVVAEPLEGTLVQVRGFVNGISDSNAGGFYNITLIDSKFNSVTLRVPVTTTIKDELALDTWYDITGIVNQYYDDYQLVIRQSADAVAVIDQPAAPSSVGMERDAVVLRGVDGDTIKLVTPVLGADNVRFLNIDTPETVYEGQSQGEHGEAAKHQLAEFLPEGTEITLKFGAEPLDKYGRLLATVVRKSDGMDVNLEMLRLGLAPTYFIYPNLTNFDAYSVAVKDAMDNQLGMWNPADPELTLPFVFRLEGAAPTKFVGNYATKEYVQPDQWATVPLEQRVFFYEEQEAIDAGYTAKAVDPTATTLISSYVLIDEATHLIHGIPYNSVPVATFNQFLAPATGATVKLVAADGVTEVTDGFVEDGDQVIVTAQDGVNVQVYDVEVAAAPTIPATTGLAANTLDTIDGYKGGLQNVITWTDSADASEFVILRNTTDSADGAQEVGTVAPGVQSFTDATPQAGVTYYYWVAASDGIGKVIGDSVSVTTAEDQTAAMVQINEVYGGGGNSGSELKNDFVELYNPTEQAISLEGWSLQYKSSTGSWPTTSSYAMNLSGAIQAHGYYLIKLSGGSNGTTDLPTADAEGTVGLAATSGKIALVNQTALIQAFDDASVVDFVGYGSASHYEGSAAAPEISATTSVQRVILGGDTNDNAADFEVLSNPTPTGSTSAN